MKTRTLLIISLLAMLAALALPGSVAQASTRPLSPSTAMPCPAAAPDRQGWSLEPVFTARAISPGVSFAHMLTLTNPGYVPVYIKLSHSGGLNEWKHELSTTYVKLAPCAKIDLWLLGVAPDLVPPKADLVTIQASDGTRVQKAQLYIYLEANH